MVKVGVVGYGVIGTRLATGVALQKDMELVGIADVGLTLSIRALLERGMPYDFYLAAPANRQQLEEAGVPIAGTLEDLVQKCDVILDATSAGVGAVNKKMYAKYGKKAVFQGGESTDVADVFFHGYANYEEGLGKQFLKLTSCNTTGLIRAVDCIDREVGVDNIMITIIRRVADPGDYHRGLTNALKVDKVPSHQASDLMLIMPHINATGVLVHTPVTHGHIISANIKPKKATTTEDVLRYFHNHPRIRVVRIADGFQGNAAMFRYARDLGTPHSDMYDIAVFEETVTIFDDHIIFAFNVPQEAVVIPESMDAVRAAMKMQTDRLEAVGVTNKYLNLG
ncbi:MAG TPA: type II glyceraldehyde-3-phosphate dehydrogenase [Firmicutes bacterium]|nr:type II glyceraldehyde-3-phosphate dehydrogenase [Bacillota bacterium]